MTVDRSVVPMPSNYDPKQYRFKLERNFLIAHTKNPKVWWLIVDLLTQWYDSGKRKCGMRFLHEIIRWQISIQTYGHEPFKLASYTTAYYARLIWDQYPEFREMFTFRKLRYPCTFGPPPDEEDPS